MGQPQKEFPVCDSLVVDQRPATYCSTLIAGSEEEFPDSVSSRAGGGLWIPPDSLETARQGDGQQSSKSGNSTVEGAVTYGETRNS